MKCNAVLSSRAVSHMWTESIVSMCRPLDAINIYD